MVPAGHGGGAGADAAPAAAISASAGGGSIAALQEAQQVPVLAVRHLKLLLAPVVIRREQRRERRGQIAMTLSAPPMAPAAMSAAMDDQPGD